MQGGSNYLGIFRVSCPTESPESTLSIQDGCKLIKIMPLGDSITAGIIGRYDRDSGGYRPELWHKLTASGLNIEFIGSISSGPDNLVNKNHEGHPGWTIEQLTSNVEGWLSNAHPDIILLMVGTNNTRFDSVAVMVNKLTNLIDRITAHSPSVNLLVASIPPIHPFKKPISRIFKAIAFNRAIPTIVQTKATQGKKVDFVDMGGLKLSDLTASLSLNLDNGLHPNAKGYLKIAKYWHEAILKVLDKKTHLSSPQLRPSLLVRYVPLQQPVCGPDSETSGK